MEDIKIITHINLDVHYQKQKVTARDRWQDKINKPKDINFA